ncbi:ABC transporter substrate-binding protein [Nannocystis pusilla]|uniref:ABC transporter substrate-binding protein n=1 Tax=Nannocystis pusilla TaxID=889268 RepID=UPI003DA1FCCF
MTGGPAAYESSSTGSPRSSTAASSPPSFTATTGTKAWNVELVAGRTDTPVVPQVAAGRAEFGVSDASQVLLARAQGAPIVALLAGLQHNPRCIMVHESSGVTGLADLRDATLAMSAHDPAAAFLLQKFNWPNVQVVPYSGSIAPFLLDPRAAQQAYVFSEPILAEAQNARVRCLMVKDLGFDPYASVLVTSEAVLRERRDLAVRIAVATARGWEQYLRDPRAANAEIQARNAELSLEAVARGAAALAPLGRGSARVGAMDLGRWQTLADQLVAAGLLSPGAVDPAQAYMPDFVR